MSAPKMMPALLGGLFIGVLSYLPYVRGGNYCCCLWLLSGGALAAWLMQQNTPRPVTAADGALVGLLSGLFGTLVWIVIAIVGLLVFSAAPFDITDFRNAMSQAEGTSPEAREALENLTPAVGLAVGSVVFTVVSVVFATIGGLLGAMLFRRKGGPGLPTPGAPGAGPVNPTFAPPTFTPPSPVVPPPFAPPPPSMPPPPPAGVAPANVEPLGAPLDADLTPLPGRALDLPPAPPAPPSGWPAPPPGGWPPPSDDPYVGDAPTIMIPARGIVMPPPPPKPPASPPAPPSGAVPPGDREPDSH